MAFDTDLYPVPTASPFDDIEQYVGLLLAAVDAELDRSDVWPDADAQTALGYVQDLKAWLVDLPIECRVHNIGEPFTKFTSTVPEGALPMDGAPRLQADYPALMAEIPASWKSGNYFTLPDMAGRGLVGQGFYYKRPDGVTDLATVGYVGGEQEHILTSAEMPAHSHRQLSKDGMEMWFDNGFTGYLTQANPGAAGQQNGPLVTGSTGGDASHNNMQPFLTAYWFIQAT